MANFRALQPAPLDEEAAPPPPQSRPLLVQKPKRTVTLGACVACRKRKSKCDGVRPICTCCSQKDTDCVYELGPNEKPSQAMKRKNEEMQGELSNLRQLYDFLRLRPEGEAMEILRRIRVNPPGTAPSQRIQELADFVRHGELPIHPSSKPPPSPYQPDRAHSVTLPPIRLALDSPSSLEPHSFVYPGMLSFDMESPTSQRRRHTSDRDVTTRSDYQGTLPPLTSIEAILQPHSDAVPDEADTDPRLASAIRWTSVTSDKRLIASILTSWIDREHSFYHYLDLDAFLDDMDNGGTDYCSALLVNALLATACSTSSAVKDRSKPFSEASIATAYYKEAVRLWDLEAGQSSLPRIHAGVCLYLVLGKLGRDKAGHVFLAEACRMSQVLGIFSICSPPSSPKSPTFSQEKWDNLRAVAAWTVFNFQLSMSYTYNFPTIIRTIPNVPIPYQQKSNTKALFRSECTKNIIILDCVSAIEDYNHASANSHIPPSSEKIEACYSRLMAWWQARPSSLHTAKNPTKENMLSAMLYYVNIINLFQPILNFAISPKEYVPYYDRARSITSASLNELRQLLAIQELRHCWGAAITLVLHPISVTSFGSLEELSRSYPSPISDAARTEAHEGLMTCLRGLAALSSYNYYAQPLLRLLTQKCQAIGLNLPEEIQHTLDNYTSKEWTRNAAHLVSSQYIADMRKTAPDLESARMDAIISTWEGMSLEERSKIKALLV